jgi:hypothetical protein
MAFAIGAKLQAAPSSARAFAPAAPLEKLLRDRRVFVLPLRDGRRARLGVGRKWLHAYWIGDAGAEKRASLRRYLATYRLCPLESPNCSRGFARACGRGI